MPRSQGDWLVGRLASRVSDFAILEKVGLIARATHGQGYYDRFRDRVMFPIRDVRGQTVGFGGRILPTSPYIGRGRRNTITPPRRPLFNKSEQLYGLDQARQAATQGGLPGGRGGLHRRADGPPDGRRPGGGHDGHGPERPARPATAALRAARGAGLRRRRRRRHRRRSGPGDFRQPGRRSGGRHVAGRASTRATCWCSKGRSRFGRSWTARWMPWSSS